MSLLTKYDIARHNVEIAKHNAEIAAADKHPSPSEFTTIRVDNHLYLADTLPFAEPGELRISLPILVGLGRRYDGQSLLSYLMRKHVEDRKKPSLIRSAKVVISIDRGFYVEVTLTYDKDRIDLPADPEIAKKVKFVDGNQKTRFAAFYDFRITPPSGNLHIQDFILTLTAADTDAAYVGGDGHFGVSLNIKNAIIAMLDGSLDIESIRHSIAAATPTNPLKLEIYDPYYGDNIFPKQDVNHGSWLPFFAQPTAGVEWTPKNASVTSIKAKLNMTFLSIESEFAMDLKATKLHRSS